jgi:hypothetical protein
MIGGSAARGVVFLVASALSPAAALAKTTFADTVTATVQGETTCFGFFGECQPNPYVAPIEIEYRFHLDGGGMLTGPNSFEWGGTAASVTVTINGSASTATASYGSAGITISPTSLDLYVNSNEAPGIDIETGATSPSGAILSSLAKPVSFSPGTGDYAGGIYTGAGDVVTYEIDYTASSIAVSAILAVPEPGVWSLSALGFAALAAFRFRRRGTALRSCPIP